MLCLLDTQVFFRRASLRKLETICLCISLKGENRDEKEKKKRKRKKGKQSPTERKKETHSEEGTL